MTVHHHVVLTAGISIFGNNNHLGRQVRQLDFLQFPRTNPIAEGCTDEEALEALENWGQALDISEVIADPSRVCAEYSALHSLRERGRLGTRPVLVVICTGTFGGMAARVLLEKILAQGFNADVKVVEVDGLDAENPGTLRQSLGTYMNEVARALSAGAKETTCFAPIGGYKMMASLGTIAGSYLGYSSIYVHEDNQRLHRIPPAPVSVSEEVLERAAPLMRKVGTAARWQELSREEQDVVRSRPYLFALEDDLVGVSAFGNFLMQRPGLRRFFGTRLLLSPALARRLDTDGGLRGRTLVRIGALVGLLEDQVGNRNLLRHDANWRNLKGASFWLYKADGGNFHAAYRYDSGPDTLRINQVWLSHDNYEADARAGSAFFDDPSGISWRDWTGRLYEA